MFPFLQERTLVHPPLGSCREDLCVGGGGAEVGLVDSLLCMNQEATSPARDGGWDDAWGVAASLCPGKEDPFLLTH